jgi:hypothetical protein
MIYAEEKIRILVRSKMSSVKDFSPDAGTSGLMRSRANPWLDPVRSVKCRIGGSARNEASVAM